MQYFIIPAFLFLCSCAVGPLALNESARTVGAGGAELSGGYGVSGYAIKFNYGVSAQWDLGLQMESLSFGARAKYSFWKAQEKGWAVAAAAGLGNSVGGHHYYGDLITSYLVRWWEPYAAVRFVHIQTDPVELMNSNTGYFNFTVPSYEYNYGQFFAGSRFWFTPHAFFILEASTFVALSSSMTVGDAFIANAAFGYRF